MKKDLFVTSDVLIPLELPPWMNNTTNTGKKLGERMREVETCKRKVCVARYDLLLSLR